MCEANAYLIKNGDEEMIMQSVELLRPEGDQLYVQSIFGEQRWIKGHIKEMDLVRHKIMIETE